MVQLPDITDAPQLQIEYLSRLLTAQLSFGAPITVDDTGAQAGQQLANIKGAWVTVSLTAAVTDPVTLTHNLNIPPTSVTGAGGTANLPNVRWFLVGLEYGDRTGATAAPAVPTGNVTFIKMVNGTVTADAIDLRAMITGFVPNGTHPVTATFFVVPAVV